MNEHQLRPASDHRALGFDAKCTPFGRCPLSPRKQEHSIGLPQTELRPFARLDIAYIDDEIVRALERVKPVARVIGTAAIPHQLRAADASQLADELRPESRCVIGERLRNDCDRPWNRATTTRLLLR